MAGCREMEYSEIINKNNKMEKATGIEIVVKLVKTINCSAMLSKINSNYCMEELNKPLLLSLEI